MYCVGEIPLNFLKFMLKVDLFLNPTEKATMFYQQKKSRNRLRTSYYYRHQ